MKKIIYFIFLIISIPSCQKAIEIDRDSVTPKLVINSVLSSQNDTIFLSLTESRDLLYDKNSFPSVKGAVVKIFENGNKIGELQYLNDLYFIPYKVKEGSTYKVEASASSFKTVTAETTVKSAIENTIGTVKILESGGLDASIKIVDIINEDNFYQVSMKWMEFTDDSTIINDPYYYQQPYYNNYSCTNDYIVEYPQTDALQGENCNDYFLFDDATIKNSTHEFKLSTPNNNYYYSQEGYKTKVILEVSSLDYNYYTYLITKSIFQFNFGNPFAEPVQVYSNIENGYGIFGSRSYSSDTLIFE